MSVNPRLNLATTTNPSNTSKTSTGSVTITYQHNANNQRVAKLVDGVVVEKYLWLNLTTLLATYDANDNLKQRFEYAGDRMPVAMTDANGTKHYLHYDQVGSLRAISDTNNNVVKEITYDTFGNILTDSNTSFKVPFGFAGGLYDSDTKLTRFGYRDYDAYTGKWTAKDPIGFDGGDSNLYGYVLGDPVNFVDPEGLSADILDNPIMLPLALGFGLGLALNEAMPFYESWWKEIAPPDIDCEDEVPKHCEEQIEEAIVFCYRAKRDPDMPNVYGGSMRTCVLARIDRDCEKYYRGY